MNNLKSAFEQLFNPTQISVAKITGDKGGGSYAATTQTGVAVTLTGTAQTGQTVFYDTRSGRITGQAPALAVVDVPV